MAPNERITIEAPINPKRAASKMQAEAKKTAPTPTGRLNRNVQQKLGDTLRAMFDEIVQEGVPDRFAKLLDQIEDRKRSREAGSEKRTEPGLAISPGDRTTVPTTENIPKANDKGST
jgi:hypothetical protein